MKTNRNNTMNALVMVAVLLSSAAPHLHAAEPAVCAKLRQHYADTTPLQIDFEQSIYWNVREKTSKKRGTATLAPGNRFRVEIGNDSWICDGVTCSHYNKENNQVVMRNFSDLDITTQPSHLLTTLLTKYRFEEKKRSGKEVTLAWHPDSSSSGEYTAITLTVTEATGTVTSLTFTDTNSNIHTYIFKKTVFGKPAPAATFEFEAPNNAYIIDNRH
jgi:outer membrane lipoprotein-sorting protein